VAAIKDPKTTQKRTENEPKTFQTTDSKQLFSFVEFLNSSFVFNKIDSFVLSAIL